MDERKLRAYLVRSKLLLRKLKKLQKRINEHLSRIHAGQSDTANDKKGKQNGKPKDG